IRMSVRANLFRAKEAQSNGAKEVAGTGILQEHRFEQPDGRRRVPAGFPLFATFNNPRQGLPGTRAKLVQQRGLMNAGDGAKGRASFGTRAFANEILRGVPGERDPGMTALLGAVVHQPLFADVEKTAAGRAVPGVGKPADSVLLKCIEVCEGEEPGSQAEDAVVDSSLARLERSQLATAVVQN